MSDVDINICGCSTDCKDLELLDTNKKDDTKENLLEVVENKDLLEIETGVPFTKKTKVYPKRDNTKLNVTTFEEYKEFNEEITNKKFDLVNEDIKDLKNKDDILNEALVNKANIEDLEKKADKTDLEKKADKSELDKKADKSDLDEKANIEDLEKKADKTELDKKAEKSELEKKADKTDLESFSNSLTEFGGLLDNKADKTDLESYDTNLTEIRELLDEKADSDDMNTELYNKADKTDLDNKADKSDLDEKANIEDLEKKADKTELDKKAEKSELEKKADKTDLESFSNSLTEFGGLLDNKADKTDLESYDTNLTEIRELLDEKADSDDMNTELYNKADKTDLDNKADKSDLDEKANIEDLEKKADKTDLEKKADKGDLEKKANKTDLEKTDITENYINITYDEARGVLKARVVTNGEGLYTGNYKGEEISGLRLGAYSVNFRTLKNSIVQNDYSPRIIILNNNKRKIVLKYDKKDLEITYLFRDNPVITKIEVKNKADKGFINNYIEITQVSSNVSTLSAKIDGDTIVELTIQGINEIRIPKSQYILNRRAFLNSNLYEVSSILDFNTISDGFIRIKAFNSLLEMQVTVDQKEVTLSKPTWIEGDLA